MSETIKWSFSSDRTFHRCQRQWFFQQLAAHHSAKDPVRREAFLSKQVKTTQLWQGLLVHRGIELWVVPAWQAGKEVDWREVIRDTKSMAERQLAFSKGRRYRESGVSKSKAGDDYCALAGHESDAGVSDEEFDQVLSAVESAYANLASMESLIADVRACRSTVRAEVPLYIQHDRVRLEVHLDLLFFRSFGEPTIVDWKVSESMGGSDADLQTGLYAWAMCKHPKWQVSDPEACELIESQLLTGDVIRRRGSADAFAEIENRMYRSVDAMLRLTEGRKYSLSDIEDYGFASNPNSCFYCSHRQLCQDVAGRELRGQLDEDESAKPKRKKGASRREQSQPQLF